MAMNYCSPSSEDDFRQILSLQQANHASTVSEEIATRDGFVTVVHTLDLLKRMNDAAPQIIAKDGDNVIGYALVMLKSFQAMIPVLVPMFEKLSGINYGDRKITDHSFYVMGQICI